MSPMIHGGDLLTEKEMAAYLKITLQSVMRWRKEGVLPFFRISRSIRYRKSDVDRVLAEKCQRGAIV